MRSRLLLLAALLPVTAAVLVPVDATTLLSRTLTAAPAGAVAPAPPATDPVRVVVETLEPRDPRPGDDMIVTGQLVAAGPTRLSGLVLELRRGPVIRTRLALQAAAEVLAPIDGPVRTPDLQLPGVLAPGQSLAFRYSTPFQGGEGLGLERTDPLGVYPLSVDVRASTGPGGGSSTVGSTRTFVPWFPEGVGSPTRLAWLWPLVDEPVGGPTGRLLDDRLATSLAPGGRLDGLLAAAEAYGTQDAVIPAVQAGQAGQAVGAVRGLPALTWAIDPALLDDVAQMADGYELADGRPGAGQSAAAGWLARLRPLVAVGRVLALPYADVDVVALTRVGLDAEVSQSLRYGREVPVPAVLGVEPIADLGWPARGLVTGAALENLITGPRTTVVLDETALPPEDGITPTPLEQVQTLAGPVDAAVADAGLSRLLAAEPDPAGSRLAEQRFLVETAMITAARPFDGQPVVAMPPRRWSADADYQRGVLAATRSVRWLEPAALTQVIEQARTQRSAGQAPERPAIAGASLVYPPEAAAAELGERQLAAVSNLRTEVADFTAALSDDRLVLPLRQGIWRAESVALRSRPARSRELLARSRDRLGELRDRIRVASRGPFTLTSSAGTVPVTIANDLDQAVTVQVRIDGRNQARLTTVGTSMRTIPPGGRPTVDVLVETRGSGTIPVDVTLLASGGQRLGPPVQLTVRSTAYGRVAVGITGAAFGVLLLAIGVRLVRRAVRAVRG